MSRKTFSAFLFVLALSLFQAKAFVYADSKADLKEGIADYRQERYDEALMKLNRSYNTDPSSLAAYYIGISYKRIENYALAKEYLIKSLELTPKIKGALIELIDTLYNLGETAEAKKWITIAEDEGIRPAQAAFLKGLTYSKAGEYQQAVQAFRDAKDLDPQLGQSADYQIGLALVKDRQIGKAKEYFEGVILADPNSSIASYADQYVKAIEEKQKDEKPLSFSFGASFQYDDNVILQPSGVSLPDTVADESDTRQTYTFGTEYNHKFNDRFGVKGAYSLYAADQNDLNSLDVLSNTVALQPNIYFEKVLIGFPTSYNYTFVDSKAYVSTVSAGSLSNILFGSSQMLQGSFLYRNKNFRSASSGAEDRNADEYIGSGALYHFFKRGQERGFVNVRYSYNVDQTKGKNWEYEGNKVSATVLYPIVDRLKMTLTGEVFFKDFDNTHTTFGTKRDDDVYTGSALMSYEFIDNAELQFQYTYVNADSNIPIYDYDRNIFSVGAQYKY